MPKKSPSFKSLVVGSSLIAGTLIALALASSLSAASAPAFKIGIQFCDQACQAEMGKVQFTGPVNLVEQGAIPSNFAADSNGYDPDGASAKLVRLNNGTIPYNFQFCAQMADQIQLDGAGNVSAASQFGAVQCTPPAVNTDGSIGGGWSPWAADNNAYDFDGGKVEIRTLGPLPQGVEIADVQFGLKFSDHGCTSQFGTPQYTGWLSGLTAAQPQSASAPAMDSNAYDPDCMAVYLQVRINNNTCKEPVPVSEQPKVNQGSQAVIGIDGTGTGWKDCASDSVLTNLHLHNNNDDRKEWDGTCTDTENLVDTNFRYTAAGGAVLAAGAPRPVYPTSDDAYCAQDEALVGALYYDDDATGSSDEGIRAIHCRKLMPGMTLDYNNVQVFPNAGCGQYECNSYNNVYGSLRSAKDSLGRPFVPVGMNIRPYDSHKYARGIWAAPLKSIPDKTVLCDDCKPQAPAIVKTFGSGDGERVRMGTSDHQFGVALEAASFDESGGWWSGTAIDYPETKWISGLYTGFVDGQGPAPGVCFDATEEFNLSMQSITAATIDYMVDDWLQFSVNGNAPFYTSGPDWLWTSPTRNVAIPISQLQANGSNTLKVHFCQGGNYGGSQMAVNYKGTITGLGVPPAPPASCSDCVAGGRGLKQPLSISQSTAPDGSSTGGDKLVGSSCAGESVHIAVATDYRIKKIVAGSCIATTPGFFTGGDSEIGAGAFTSSLSCPAGSVISQFIETGIRCRPVAGGAGAFVPGSTKKIVIGGGTAVNNYFSFVENNSTKIWVPIAVEYQGGQPYQRSVTVAELRTAPSCDAPLAPPQTGALRINRFVRTAEGGVGQPAVGTKAGINSNNLIADNPAVLLQLGAGSYPVFATDLPGEEKFGICQFPIGGAGCSPTGYNTIPASLCTAGVCALPVAPVVGAKMTVVVVTYAPATQSTPPPPTCTDSIDNDGDGLADANDPDCDPDDPRGEHGGTVQDTCTFTATPATIVLNVGSSQLAWNCSKSPVNITDNRNAVNDDFPDIGNKPDAIGFVNVAPDKTTTFTVHAGTATASATVTVGGSIIDETGGL